MKLIIALFFISILSACQGQATKPIKSTEMVDTTKKYNQLSEQEERVLVHKATDRAFTGDYYNKKDKGIYLCRQCNNPLYTSDTKFESHCGWPSFDDEIDGSVTRVPDADGRRIEIICTNCKGHLGHVFEGEQFTAKNTRHCVNTSSLKFYTKEEMKTLPAVIK
jgi:peptide-methionine (R)-S-oxide reductase